jgi:hypothetical protein
MKDGSLRLSGGSLRVLGDTSIEGYLYETSKLATLTVGGVVSTVAGFSQTAGNLTISSGTFDLSGTTNVLGGIVTGNELYLDYGSVTTFRQGLKLTTAELFISDGTLDVDANISYAGQFSAGGTIDLSGKNLTLGGTAGVGFYETSVVGTGTISIAHQSTLESPDFSGFVTLKNSGHMSLGGLAFVADLLNEESGSINASGFIEDGSLVNMGSMALSSETIADPITINTGNIEIGSGTVEFLYSVSGDGAFKVDPGAELKFDEYEYEPAGSGGTISLGAYASLSVSAYDFPTSFGDTISGFASGDMILVQGFYAPETTLAFDAVHDVLQLTFGSSSVNFQLTGSYSASDFYLFSHDGTAAVGHI